MDKTRCKSKSMLIFYKYIKQIVLLSGTRAGNKRRASEAQWKGRKGIFPRTQFNRN